MRVLLTIFFLSIFSYSLFGQKIDKYTAKVDFNKTENTYYAHFIIDFRDLKPNDTIKLFLHKNANIHYVSSMNNTIKYKLSDEKLLGEDNAILISTNDIINNCVNISYVNDLKAIKNPNFKYNPDWIELNLYTSWFPLNIEYGLFAYEISVNTEDRLIGSNVSDDNVLQSVSATYDIPLIISDKISEMPIDNGKIKLYHYGVSDSIINKIQEKSAKFFLDYTLMFGSTDSDNLSIAINSFNRTINYARPQFISSSINDKYSKTNEKTLAHEIGHLWWNKADVGTWHDWLNEGFAEFSALLIYRNVYGKKAYVDKIKTMANRIENSPAIWEIEFLNPNRNTALTYKSAYLLYLLEIKVGEEKMLELLKETHSLKIEKTDDFLMLLTNNCGTKINKWFEKELRK